MKPNKLLRDVLKRIRSAAGTFEDNRQGPNLRYTLADAVLSAFACFFLQSPSFLAFQRRMQDDVGRSNCQTLFGMQGIPSDGQIRNLLDRLVPDSFQLDVVVSYRFLYYLVFLFTCAVGLSADVALSVFIGVW